MAAQHVNTTLTNDIHMTNGQRMYDESCKKILSNKMILAWIMKECIAEFKDTEITDIANFYIEEQPEISNAEVFGSEKIHGLSTEMINDNNDKIFYDIRYRTTVPTDNEETTELIINIEAQNKYHVNYPLIKRGLFYASRMLSHQHGTEFDKLNYNKLKKVYSIWICHNVPKKIANSITRYEMAEQPIAGCMQEDKKNYDLTSVVMIFLGKETDKPSSLVLNLLNCLLSENLSAEEKLEMLEVDYNIPKTKKLKEELIYMCNLSQGVLERGFNRGISQGIAVGESKKATEITKNLLKMGLRLEQIVQGTGLTVAEIQKLENEL